MSVSRAQPNAADYERAERFVAETWDNDPSVSPLWLETKRAGAVKQAAMLEMGKRQEREFKAAMRKSASADKRAVRIVEKELPAVRDELRKILAA